MKVAVTFIAALLPLLGLGNPIAKPVPEAIPGEIFARKTCTIIRNTVCRAGAGTGYAAVRNVARGSTVAVVCKAYGGEVGGNR